LNTGSILIAQSTGRKAVSPWNKSIENARLFWMLNWSLWP